MRMEAKMKREVSYPTLRKLTYLLVKLRVIHEVEAWDTLNAALDNDEWHIVFNWFEDE